MRTRTEEQIHKWIEKYYLDPLGLLAQLNGYYECPKSKNNERLGPLVGYAGRYGEKNLQYVGEVYANFAVVEEEPAVLSHFANFLSDKMMESMRMGRSHISTYCGAPMGGIALAYQMARVNQARFLYPDKKVAALATSANREKSKLVFGRHQLTEGESVAICEDVLNNFSTTEEMIALIESAGAEVVAIIGLLNRSAKVRDHFEYQGKSIPVFSLVQKEIAQWQQDDPVVAADVAAGNVVWKPKDEWTKLKQAMEAAVKQ